MEKNKIALVTYSLSAGGLERIVANSTFLFEEMGYEVHLYVVNSSVDYPFTGTLHCYKIDTLSTLGKAKAYIKLKQSIQSHGFHTIIDHRYRLNKATELFWQKVIYRQQNVLHYIHSARLYNYIFRSKLWNKLLFKNQLFICVSKGIEEQVRAVFPALHTQTIYNYVQIDEPTVLMDMPQKYIVALGRMDHSNVKQIDVLLACYAASTLPLHHIHLLILGDGIRLKQMQQLAIDLGISNTVSFKGFVKNPSPYLKQALFTTLTSKYEGLPTVLIESLLLGTPVVSFNCATGPNEIVEDGQNGLLVADQHTDQFTQALNQMIDDDEQYQYMKNNCQSTVSKFQKAFIKAQWQQVLSGTRSHQIRKFL